MSGERFMEQDLANQDKIGFEQRNPSKRSQQLLVSSYLGQTAEKVKDWDRNR